MHLFGFIIINMKRPDRVLRSVLGYAFYHSQLPTVNQLGDVRKRHAASYKGPSYMSAFTVSGGWTQEGL